MELRMSPAEAGLFRSFVSCASSYLEFGAGGSTVLASELVAGPVYSIESDTAWIDKVKGLAAPSTYERKFLFADIGQTGHWGVPTNPHGEVDYLNYHQNIWEYIDREFDMYFIDGRFRVACACQSLLRCKPDSIMLIHDYRSRRHYHMIEKIAAPIAEAEDMTAFRRRPEASFRLINEVLAKYEIDHA